MSQPAAPREPQREARVTALDVFASALRLVVEERAKSVKDGKQASLLALDGASVSVLPRLADPRADVHPRDTGLAGLVAAYLALNHQHGLELASAYLLLDTRWPYKDALVTFCHDSAEAPPPLVHHLLQENRACLPLPPLLHLGSTS